MAKRRKQNQNNEVNPAGESMSAQPKRRDVYLVSILLAAITAIAYLPTLRAGFIYYFDDQLYVAKNVVVQSGLSMDGLRWAFTTTSTGNWHPLTWLSLMLDSTIYHSHSAPVYHITNLLLHIVNTLFLFLILKRMTKALWKSAFVAVLFAIHPLHVESVAWISERKDLLSTLLLLSAVWAYISYASRPSITRYLAVAASMILGLMAKPMLVTLPIILLIMDYWPLSRRDRTWRQLVLEKTPLLVISAASSIVTVFAQKAGGALASITEVPVALRLENVVVSYCRYILKMVWPSKLAVFYPFPQQMALGTLAASVLLLAGISYLILRNGRNRPYLLAGWLWYIVTLLPVIGLVQIGGQAIADRYTYIPLIGLFVIVSWGLSDLAARLGKERWLPIGAMAVVLVLSVCTWSQASLWIDNITLFRHAIDVTTDNSTMYNNLGAALNDNGDYEDASVQLEKAIEIDPEYAKAYSNLGISYAKSGRLGDAIESFKKAVSLDAGNSAALNNLGRAFAQTRDRYDAEQCFRKAVSLFPEDAESHGNLGMILMEQKSYREAAEELAQAIKLNPGYANAHQQLSMALFYTGDYSGAKQEVQTCEDNGWPLPQDFIKAVMEK